LSGFILYRVFKEKLLPPKSVVNPGESPCPATAQNSTIAKLSEPATPITCEMTLPKSETIGENDIYIINVGSDVKTLGFSLSDGGVVSNCVPDGFADMSEISVGNSLISINNLDVTQFSCEEALLLALNSRPLELAFSKSISI